MSSQQLDREERKHLRFTRLAIYAFPVLAGLLTVSIAVTADVMRLAQDQFIGGFAFLVNAFIAGAASAFTVARQHPHERGKWWRAGASFLFAFPMTLISTIAFGACAGLIKTLTQAGALMQDL